MFATLCSGNIYVKVEKLPYKRILARTLVTDEGERQLMYIDLTGPEPIIEPFGGIERHSTIFIDGRVTLGPTYDQQEDRLVTIAYLL